MKALRRLLPVLAILLSCALPPRAPAATTYTDGAASFTVNLISIPGNYSQRVDAYWVTDASGAFVTTVRYDAGSRRGYLDQWEAARGTWPYNAPIDGFSGATINTWGTFTVNWDCRDTNNVLMPDGTYKFWVEMTDQNGPGPYTTNGIPFYKGLTNVNNTYPNQQYIQNIAVTYTPSLAYDIAVTRIGPAFAPTNALAPITVTVANKTSVPESFTVTLSNATSGTLIGSVAVDNLGGNEVTNVSFTWNTVGLAFGGYSIVARASAVPNETALADNTLTSTITLRPPTHDVAVASIAVPATVRPDMRTNVTVTVTNKGDLAESFAVVLTDDTDSKTIGTNQVSNLGAQTATTTLFQWNTTNASWGAHSLRAVAGPVPEETSTADNTAAVFASVMPPPTTNTYITRNSLNWRYNDANTDLGTAWRQPVYPDGGWSVGRAPFGYGDAPTNTVLRPGPSVNPKYPTYYFRKTFEIAALPLPTSLVMNLRRDDGVVVYHNGVEIYRFNITNNPVYFTNLAITAVGAPDETTYFPTNLSTTNAVLGTNLIAVEVHQQALDSSDLSFDLELLGVVPPLIPAHDVAVAAIVVPPQVLPGTRTNVTVRVANQGTFTESLAVVLSDDTDAVTLGSSQVNNLVSGAITNVTFAWDVPGVPFVAHTLRAVAGPVASESSRFDNTNTTVVLVSPLMETNVFIAKGSVWRCFDQGVDLTDTPWKATNYYDLVWKSGPAPLGYSDNGQHTNIATVLSWGPAATNKYPTYYFRQEFFADALPVSLALNVRRDDGVIFYLNGAELARMNAPDGPIRYTDFFANNAVDGAAQYTYLTTNAPATNVVLGRNVLAAELHQVNATNADIVLDVELVGTFPKFDRIHDVDVLEVAAPTDALAGDRMPVTVTLTNRGNATEIALVVLKDTLTGLVIGSQTVTNLMPGGAVTVQFNWATLGASNGTHSLQAYTVVGGVTNLAGAATGPGVISGSGFATNVVNVSGTIGGRCATLTTTSNLLLVGSGATLEVWDRSDPAGPVPLGAVRLPGLVEQIVVGGAWAYAACGHAGVQFVDLATPGLPRHRLTFDTSGHAYGVAVSTNNNYLYVADGVAGVRIVNIANPMAPSLVGALYTEGPARAVALSGSFTYVVDQHKGLRIFNTANPAAPTSLGTNTAVGAGQAIRVAGNYAYIVDANNRFYVVGVGNPLNPPLTATLVLTNQVGQALAQSGTTMYVAAGDGGLLVLSVATPSAPRLVSTLPTAGQAGGLAVAGSTLYLADGFAGFQIFNVSAPASPAHQAELAAAVRASEVAVSGGLAYVAAGEAGLRIYAVTNPTTPKLLGVFVGATNARALAVSGATAYVGDGQYGLKLVDVANPATPTLVGAYVSPDLGFIRNVGVSGSQILVSDGRNVALLDAGNPASPVLRATYSTPGFAYSMAVSGGNAYLACGNFGVIILGITPTALTPASTYDTPGFATGVAVSGTTAHVADGPGGGLMLDVANPAAPRLIGPSTLGGSVTDVAVSGVLATLANGANVAAQLDVTTPLTPVTKKVFTGLVRAMRMAATGEQTFVAEDEAGLAILDSSADSDHDGLTDTWEQQIINANVNDRITTILDVQPGDDFDGDDASNLAEFLGGTLPTDSASVFVLRVEASGGARATIQWHSVGGKTYTIYKTTDLGAGFSVLQDDVAATPPLNTFTDPAPGASAFYVISVR